MLITKNHFNLIIIEKIADVLISSNLLFYHRDYES